MQTTLNFAKKSDASEKSGSLLAKPAVSHTPFAENIISQLKDESWKKALQPEFNKPYFSKLMTFLSSKKTFYPPQELVFNAYNRCPLDKVRVVILGQDPYILQNQAMGMSFSVPSGVPVPPSLRNIYKELQNDLGASSFQIPTHGDLTYWATQGVLLLNAVLTVDPGESNSHAKQGWEEFTDATIRVINDQRKGVVFLLWGKPAQTKGKLVNTSKHVVFTAAHPSPLAADKGFFGCKHFSKTNAVLEKPLDWQIPPAEKRPAAAEDTSPSKKAKGDKKEEEKNK